MAENKTGRVVEEPLGYDHTPTESIPAQGDLPSARTAPDGTKNPTDTDRTPAEPVLDAEPLDNRVDTEPVPVHRADTEPLPEQREDTAATTPVDESPSEVRREPATSLVHDDAPSSTDTDGVGFFEADALGRFRDRWRELQVGFVDDPARAVRGADELIDEVMRGLTERKRNIDEQWRGDSADTEGLRVVIQEYRAFFNQLLNV